MKATTTKRIGLALLGLWAMAAVSAQAALPLVVDGEPLPSLAPLVKRVAPAVVNIQVKSTVTQRNPFGNDPLSQRFFNNPGTPRERTVQGQGSGVIVDAENGYIVTNHHVVEGADEIEVTLQDNRSLSAEIIGSDKGTDIAVLKVDAKNLTEIAIGDSDAAEVGDFVIAIGNPFGLSHTVTSGIISAEGRYGIGGPETYEDFIQTDASINPGNSGGALLNLRGELIGVNSAILSRSGGNIGIGFAIPSKITQSVMRQLLEFGEVRRGLLGVSIAGIDKIAAKDLGLDITGGAMVTEVVAGSAADEAGIEINDIVTAVNGEPVENARELSNSIGLMAAGDKVEVSIIRNKKPKKIKVTLGQRGGTLAGAGESIHPGLDGATFASESSGSGVEVVAVEEESAAARWQLAPGDIILQVNQRPVNSLEQLNEVVGDSRVLWLLIRRGNTRIMRQVR